MQEFNQNVKELNILIGIVVRKLWQKAYYYLRPMVKGKFPNKVEFGPEVNLVKKGKDLFLQKIEY